nr:hypothetical protein BaRGS_004016 [Batillaria attramentaria]
MAYAPRGAKGLSKLTCVYLACKVEEFYVPIGQFVSNLKGNREKFADTILAFELLLLSKLHYQLTVHHPFRPLEGLLIDIKTRLPELDNPERLRKTAEEFIDKCLMTDVILIFAPSQIALAAIMHSASKESINLDRYVTEVLMCGSSQEEVQKCIYQLRRIKHIVKAAEPVPREQAHLIQKKMERCRNQENNPESEVYKTKMADLFDDEEETRSQKRARRDEEQIVTYFLTVAEERLLVRQYEFVLKEFWNKFQPPAPKCILVLPSIYENVRIGSMNYLRLVTRYARLVMNDARLVICDARLVICDARLVMRYPRLVMGYPRLVMRYPRLVMGYRDN